MTQAELAAAETDAFPEWMNQQVVQLVYDGQPWDGPVKSVVVVKVSGVPLGRHRWSRGLDVYFTERKEILKSMVRAKPPRQSKKKVSFERRWKKLGLSA